MILSVLCQPTRAVEHPGSQSRALEGHFVDGRITFDQDPVPQPVLQRREDSSTTTATLPRAFDSGFGTNYTQPSCPTFLRSMVNNETFVSCVPFSLLLQNSMSFFDASRSVSTITTVLNASCSVFFPTCSTLMSSFALTLRSSAACQEDYNSENPQVRQAYAGLLAYDVSYNASCLKNSPTPAQDNGNYCFANAITNRSSPSDSYVYYLPLGMRLPSGSLPTCDACLARTMAVYAGAASNKSQPLNLDYVDSATMINQMCGPGFVEASIPNAGSYSAGGKGKKSSSSATALRAVDGRQARGRRTLLLLLVGGAAAWLAAL